MSSVTSGNQSVNNECRKSNNDNKKDKNNNKRNICYEIITIIRGVTL